MPHKKRKVRKQRGSRTHGYGQVGQHRGGGQRGGHGQAGFQKHRWTYTVKYDPDRYKHHGFTPIGRNEVNTINVGQLDEQIGNLLKRKHAKRTKAGIVVPLTDLGYDKLLGTGHVTHPLVVHIAAYSKSAAKKIVAAGGKILNPER